MAGRTYSAAEVSALMGRIAAARRRGLGLIQALETVGVPHSTYRHWMKRFVGLDGVGIQVVRDLLRENARLKRAIEEYEAPLPFGAVEAPLASSRPAPVLRIAARRTN